MARAFSFSLFIFIIDSSGVPTAVFQPSRFIKQVPAWPGSGIKGEPARPGFHGNKYSG
jgi:hypothetical protein